MFSEKNSDIFSSPKFTCILKKRIFENISRKIFSRIRNLTLISRKIFSRICPKFAKISSAKISSRENIFSRKYLPLTLSWGGGGGVFYVRYMGGGGGSGKFAVPHFSVPTHAETMKFGTIVCNQ